MHPESLSLLEIPETRRRVPAWAMSAVFHAVAVIAAAWMFRPAVSKSLTAEPDRPVSIVLAEAGANQTVQYLENDRRPSTAAVAGSAAETGTEGDGSPIAFLPQNDTPPPTLPGITLPARNPVGPVSGDGLVVSSSAKRPGGRPFVASDPRGDEKILEYEANRVRPEKPVGPPAEVSLFGGAPSRGHTFVFVIDRSKSMGGEGLNALNAARLEFSSSLSVVGENHKFQVIAYNHQTISMNEGLAKGTDGNKRAINGFIENLASFGGTDHELALNAALRLRPDVIYLLTDGGDPHLNDPQLKQIKARAGNVTTIHCIQFGIGPLQEEDNFMQKLARQNGGGFSYVEVRGRRK